MDSDSVNLGSNPSPPASLSIENTKEILKSTDQKVPKNENKRRTPTAQRSAQFWSGVDKRGPDECWRWKGLRGEVTHSDYGSFNGERTHRVAYELTHGPIPAELIVRHTCDNPPCCNPAHLLIGTTADNARDAMERGRLPTGDRHKKSKLSDAQVSYIRLNPRQLRGIDLAKMFDVTKSTISEIRSGKHRRTPALQ